MSMEGTTLMRSEKEGSEPRTFSAGFVGHRMKTLLSSDKDIKKVESPNAMGGGNKITLTTTIVVEKGPTKADVGIVVVLENRGDTIVLKSYEIDTGKAIKGKVEDMLEPKLDAIPEMIKSNLEKGEGRKIEKMQIVNGELKVTFAKPEAQPKKTPAKLTYPSPVIPAFKADDFSFLHDSEPSTDPLKNFAPEDTGAGVWTDQEVRTAEQEIEKLPEIDREKIGWGLSTIGFKVEKIKDVFFSGIFNKALKSVDGKGTVGRFCTEARDYFTRNAKEAAKKANASSVFNDRKILGLNISGKTQRGAANIGAFSRNVLKYGRMVADATGLSPSSIPRYVMAAGMATAVVSEMGKEARLKNEEVVEKTRIQDIEIAQMEAMAIYNNALVKEGKAEGEKVSNSRALKDAYIMEMPKDLQKRLENPSAASTFIQRILKKDLEGAILKLNTAVVKIDIDTTLSDKQREEQKEQLLNRQRKNLEDYDRIITQYGTVDELAMAARYAQTAGKAVVGALQVETLILSVEKMWGALSRILSSPDTHENVHGLVGGRSSAGRPVVESAPQPQFHPEAALASAVVHKGEGIEHAFIRQIENNPKLAQDIGFKGNIYDKSALHAFAQHEADVTAIKTGYVDRITGREVRVAEAGKIAYEIKIENGHRVVYEKTLGGRIIETHREGDNFKAKMGKYKYRYYKK